MKKRQRELFIQERIREQAEEARETKLFKLGQRCHYFTVALLWITAFGALLAMGTSVLYLLS